MDIARDGNVIEAFVWFAVAAVLAWKSAVSERRLRGTLLGLTFVIATFGASDLIESRTGAWWRPWWLLVWKACCVLGILWGFTRWYRLTRRKDSPGRRSPPPTAGAACVLVAASLSLSGAEEFRPKPVPRLQALPLPHHQISFERGGHEIARYHFDPTDKRTFLYPIIGPSGRSLTRMGHPGDPFTHSHHNSLWVSHRDVNGINFWENGGRGQIRHLRTEQFEDGEDSASATVLNAWGETNRVILRERRRMTTVSLASNEWLLLLDMRFDAVRESVTFGKTSFGLAAVRMAKSIGVNDGGGMIRNSEGGVNEPGVHWKRARWVDYSGASMKDVVEGITFFDHPNNPNHPSVFHVRNDGWMGASLTFDEPLVVATNEPLVLRYGFFIHRGLPDAQALNERWSEFTRMPVPTLAPAKR